MMALSSLSDGSSQLPWQQVTRLLPTNQPMMGFAMVSHKFVHRALQVACLETTSNRLLKGAVCSNWQTTNV